MKTRMILTAIAAVTAAPALAGERPTFPSHTFVMHHTVSFSDLDISRAAGADALIARLRSASRKVCGDFPNPGEMDNAQRHQRCMVEATDAAVKQVNAPLVTARYARDPVQPRFATK